jgi:hypothetical protein
MEKLPINKDILLKRKSIPIMLAKLSYIDPEATINFLRIWGEKKSPITPLYEEIISSISDYQQQD